MSSTVRGHPAVFKSKWGVIICCRLVVPRRPGVVLRSNEPELHHQSCLRVISEQWIPPGPSVVHIKMRERDRAFWHDNFLWRGLCRPAYLLQDGGPVGIALYEVRLITYARANGATGGGIAVLRGAVVVEILRAR